MQLKLSENQTHYDKKTAVLLPWSENLTDLPPVFASHKSALLSWLEEKDLKEWQCISFTLPLGEYLQSFVLYRVGEDYRAYRMTQLGSRLARAAAATKKTGLSLVLPKSLEKNHALRLVTALALGFDAFDTYQEKKDPQPQQLTIYGSNRPSQEDLNEVEARLNAIRLAKRLGNEPANVMTPTLLAEEATKALEPLGVKVTVRGPKEIEEIGMKAFLSVAKGSEQEPRLIVMEYLNNPDSDKRLALVGKGLTYDSGGYSIKPTSGMLTMKADMCGSAAVIGAMALLAASRAKVNVFAVVASCENMISGGAYKPGDIIGSLAGKHIEIDNTDAEGRLTLVDAIYYAHSELGATHLIDICTLTGACVVALGEEITGVMTTDEELWNSLSKAVVETGDKVWRMPVDGDMLEGLKSKVADLKNTGPRWGGMMTAGLFIREFTAKKPWMHLDIAGPAFQEKSNDFYAMGATGAGAEYLARLAENLFA